MILGCFLGLFPWYLFSRFFDACTVCDMDIASKPNCQETLCTHTERRIKRGWRLIICLLDLISNHQPLFHLVCKGDRILAPAKVVLDSVLYL